MNVGILEPRDFAPEAMNLLSGLGQVSCYDGVSGADAFLADKTALFVRLAFLLDGRLLGQASSLKVIVSPTTALNHIDLAAAERAGISVLSLRGETGFLRSDHGHTRACPRVDFCSGAKLSARFSGGEQARPGIAINCVAEISLE